MKKQKRKKIIFYIVFGAIIGLTAKFAGFLFKTKKKNNSVNFAEFWNDEKNEFYNFRSGKEHSGLFVRNCFSILKDYFIPHQGNSHKPKMLHNRQLAIITISVLLLKASLIGYLLYQYTYTAKMSEEMEKKVLELINSERSDMSLPPVALNPILKKSALAKANDMIEQGYFAHYGPDGKKPWDWINRSEYKYLFVGENLAMNFMTAESVHKALMASPTHKKNILNDRYKEAGIAIVSGSLNGVETNVMVQIFAVEQHAPLVLAATDDNTAAGSTKIMAEQTAPAADSRKEEIAVMPPEQVKAEEKIAAAKEAGEESGAGGIEGDNISPEYGFPLSLLEKEEIVRQRIESLAGMPGQAKAISTQNPGFDFDKLALLAANGPNEYLLSDNHEISSFAQKNSGSLKFAMAAKWALFALMCIVAAVMAITVIVRMKLDHKPAAIHTLLVILLIAGLITVRITFLDSGIPHILLI